MYGGHEYLSCIKLPITRQVVTKNAHRLEKAEAMDLAADRRDLISAANKVFGKDKWSHAVVSQTLDFVDVVGGKCCVGCVSFVRVQLDDGNFHEDVGYYSAEESTKGLSIQNARIGSAVNALKKVLLSFGDNIEKELQQLQKQISPEPANNVQKDESQSLDKQVSKNSDISIDTVTCKRCGGRKYPDIISRAAQTDFTSESESNKVLSIKSNKDLLIKDSVPMNTDTTDNKTNSSSTVVSKISSVKTVELSPNKTNTTSEQKSKSALSSSEIQRMERKRKQQEKQMEFKKRMMEKEGLLPTGDNKRNPRY